VVFEMVGERVPAEASPQPLPQPPAVGRLERHRDRLDDVVDEQPLLHRRDQDEVDRGIRRPANGGSANRSGDSRPDQKRW
jgi:hypothetical protein